jgi:hypothetical protein
MGHPRRSMGLYSGPFDSVRLEGRRFRALPLCRLLWLRPFTSPERAKWPEHQDVPGGSTGYVVSSYRVIGGGPSAEKIKIHEVDVALLKELREIEKQTAIELGQWVERSRVDNRKLEDLSEEELRAKIAAMEAEEARIRQRRRAPASNEPHRGARGHRGPCQVWWSKRY